MRLATAVIATVYLLPPPSTRLLSVQALAADTSSFTRQVSPSSETNATEPSVAVDRSDGTEWVAWQASGTHVARSDDGGHTFVQTPNRPAMVGRFRKQGIGESRSGLHLLPRFFRQPNQRDGLERWWADLRSLCGRSCAKRHGRNPVLLQYGSERD